MGVFGKFLNGCIFPQLHGHNGGLQHVRSKDGSVLLHFHIKHSNHYVFLFNCKIHTYKQLQYENVTITHTHVITLQKNICPCNRMGMLHVFLWPFIARWHHLTQTNTHVYKYAHLHLSIVRLLIKVLSWLLVWTGEERHPPPNDESYTSSLTSSAHYALPLSLLYFFHLFIHYLITAYSTQGHGATRSCFTWTWARGCTSWTAPAHHRAVMFFFNRLRIGEECKSESSCRSLR